MTNFVFFNQPRLPHSQVKHLDVGQPLAQVEGIVSVLFLRLNEVVSIPVDHATDFNPANTGDSFERKICDRCFRLLPTESGFENNRIKKEGITKRPSCRDCRKIKNGLSVSLKERRKWNEVKPDDFSMFTCPVCSKPSIVGITKLVLDHCHKTGTVRGWICESCNTGLGRFDDDGSLVSQAIAWLSGPQRQP